MNAHLTYEYKRKGRYPLGVVQACFAQVDRESFNGGATQLPLGNIHTPCKRNDAQLSLCAVYIRFEYCIIKCRLGAKNVVRVWLGLEIRTSESRRSGVVRSANRCIYRGRLTRRGSELGGRVGDGRPGT